MNEIVNARGICAVCGKPIVNRPKTCEICGDSFCYHHDHTLAMCKNKGMDVLYACPRCIEAKGLKVIDPNHPLYLNQGVQK